MNHHSCTRSLSLTHPPACPHAQGHTVGDRGAIVGLTYHPPARSLMPPPGPGSGDQGAAGGLTCHPLARSLACSSPTIRPRSPSTVHLPPSGPGRGDQGAAGGRGGRRVLRRGRGASGAGGPSTLTFGPLLINGYAKTSGCSSSLFMRARTRTCFRKWVPFWIAWFCQ